TRRRVGQADRGAGHRRNAVRMPGDARRRRSKAMTASNEWGRVDADGTVWVRTATAERAVGSWQAGPPEAGLAHFVRRYQDLATEVTLLEIRLRSGAGDPRSTFAQARTLRDTLPTAAATGGSTRRCGSGWRRPGMRSPSAAARTSRRWTSSGSRLGLTRRSWSRRPSKQRSPRTGVRPRPG